MPDRPTCKDCRFWENQGERTPRDNLAGVCRRYAPSGVNWEEWPRVLSDDWCGEHQPYEAIGKIHWVTDGPGKGKLRNA